jgi:S1-C subfamily serine protease
MRREIAIRLFTVLILGGLFCFQAASQTPVPRAQEKQKRKTGVSPRVNPVIVQNEDISPQIVTILHRLNGLKIMRLLGRSNEELSSISTLDEAFKISQEVHTNVIAGLALDDGHTIAAWLPEAEAEMPPPPAFQYGPAAPVPPHTLAPPRPESPRGPPAPVTPSVAIPVVPPIPFAGNLLEPADLKVITRDGKRLMGRYLGLDGLTGLSVITLGSDSLPPFVEPEEETVTVGQRLRVIGPQPAPRHETGDGSAMYVRIGQTDASVVNVNRSPSGGIARIKIKSNKFSAANIGGIAINDAGETLGIVDSVEGSEATIVPVALVRRAAERVVTRQASVPRPWLGIQGEPIQALSLKRILEVGWQLERARQLTEKRSGILLTSVAPGSPAALNKLKPGDVILTVNNEDIGDGEEFTWLLQEAEPGVSLQFTVARPGETDDEELEIQLTESPDPLFGHRSQVQVAKSMEPGSLMAQGIESVAIKPKVAKRFGANGGLLVVYVQPASEAFKAGLRSGDVIEAIDGHQLFSDTLRGTLVKNPGASSAFSIVRNKQKLVVTISTSHNK